MTSVKPVTEQPAGLSKPEQAQDPPYQEQPPQYQPPQPQPQQEMMMMQAPTVTVITNAARLGQPQNVRNWDTGVCGCCESIGDCK